MPQKTNDTLSYTTSTGITQEARGVIVMAINPIVGTDSTTYTDSAGNQREAQPVVILGGNMGAARRQVVAGRGAVLGGVANSGTTLTRQETRMKIFFGPAPVRDIQLIFTNFTEPTGTAPEIAGPNPITIEAALETITPVGFVTVTFGGAPTYTIQPGGFVISDPIPLDFAANGQAWLRTGLTVTAGQSWPRTSMFAITGESMYESTEATSQVQATGAMVARTTGVTGGGGYIPLAITGVASKPLVSVALVGDSIMAGTVGDGSDNTNGLRGMYARGLKLDDGSIIPYTLLARASEKAEYNVNVKGYRRRMALNYATHAIINFGTNDIAGGASLATTQGYLTEMWAGMKSRNIKVYQALILPRTNAGNTAPVANFTVGSIRDQLNTWIRAQVAAGVIDGLIDTNAIAESTVTPGLWANSAWTTDGTHPNNTGCVALSVATRNVVKNWFS